MDDFDDFIRKITQVYLPTDCGGTRSVGEMDPSGLGIDPTCERHVYKRMG